MYFNGLLSKTHIALSKEFLTILELAHCKERQGVTSFLKLALRAQTLDLRPFRFTKNGYQELFTVRFRVWATARQYLTVFKPTLI